HLIYLSSIFFSLYVPATTDIYTLSLHDALPISSRRAHVALLEISEVGAEDQRLDQRLPQVDDRYGNPRDRQQQAAEAPVAQGMRPQLRRGFHRPGIIRR